MRGVPKLEEPLQHPVSAIAHCNVNQKRTKNSKNPTNPIRQRVWAIVAITEPNFAQDSIIGPMNREMKKREMRIAAFHTTGPMAIRAIRMRGLGCWFPSLSGNDLTNIYATTKRIERQMGHRTSEKMTDLQLARGTSPDSFSEGCPNFFFL